MPRMKTVEQIEAEIRALEKQREDAKNRSNNIEKDRQRILELKEKLTEETKAFKQKYGVAVIPKRPKGKK